ncbi:Uncharacterised protein [Mycobacteroides abscessus subsp. abscessus]|nr:Uncharacterised protein [Mycobacteroides abscessus subsp. abscessus]
MALLEAESEIGGDHRCEIDLGLAEKAPGQFGVEDRLAAETEFAQAGQILIGGVQYPFRAVEGLDHRGECLGLADRVEQEGAGASATQLNEVRPLRVSISRGAFGIDGDGAGSGGKAFGGIGELRRAGQHGWNTVGGCEQWFDGRLCVDLDAGVGGPIVGRTHLAVLTPSRVR